MLLYNAYKFFLDLGLGEPGLFIGLFVARVDAVKVAVLRIKVPDKNVREISWRRILGLEPVTVVVGDKTAVQIQKLIKLSAH